MPGQEEENELELEILRYFVRNPQAADTLEGVTRWRLLDERVRRTVPQVDRALRELVTQGFLIEIPTAASGLLFRLNDARRRDAEEVVGAEDDEGT